MIRLDWNELDETQRAAALARPQPVRSLDLVEGVKAIVADIRERGDAAVADWTERLDGCRLDTPAVTETEFVRARDEVSADVVKAMTAAIERVRRFHEAQLSAPLRMETADGVVCEYLQRPIRRVGLYAPAGSAPLPSTVWMLAVPAVLAGCPEVVLVTPPRSDGTADPLILTAARLCGIDRVYKIGGAQAIAALAYGTATIAPCDKLFGPGNAWVTQAKLQIATDPLGAAIDLPAGPSEVMVLADDSAEPAIVAGDMLAQAEHGEDSQVILLSTCGELIDAVIAQIQVQLATLPRKAIAAQALLHARLIRVANLAQGIDIANRYAPEHLIVQTREPRDVLTDIDSAGSVFLGSWSPETVGDYCAGPNHVLPTMGYARTCSGVGIADFQRRMSVQELSAEGLRTIGPEAALLARSERLEAHARAVDLRLARLAAAGSVAA